MKRIQHHPPDYPDVWVHDPLVQEDRFRGLQPEQSALPSLEAARNLLPDPYGEGNTDAIAWITRERVFRNLRQPKPGAGLIANFIDSAINDRLFMWGHAFILTFARQGCRAFNFQRALNPFHAR